ncbi:Predicted phosphoglycerate mutase, AP superfamily [Actinomyces bovis]|uniref:Predicted phosphoglycerate mutase, AP superfamily n=1 Tax=Actinomyces bovis TaxID=1658 RepID=A0ABY1VK07_9ACTO|nr:alkaline phosphatase family protein [Actinomyces bovis]SPT52440.1 Predicted phosphoglycerate mutase, AP superfamily [Actinomyces bovis]VEG54090.1 Predicted phosphoglycerate mutase, AP superfamily [Actinomyces israelii]
MKQVEAAPQLRELLGITAVAAGLQLAEPTPDPLTGASPLTHAEATRGASALGLLPDTEAVPGAVLVLVDGLGLAQLRERRGHAPTLRRLLNEAENAERSGQPGPTAQTCRPSTTAAAITTLGTGALPGMTGMVGYAVLHPGKRNQLTEQSAPHPGQLLGLISWEHTTLDPRSWQDVPTIFEGLQITPGAARSHQDGAATPLAVAVSPARFSGSGLTEAALRGASHHGTDRLESRAGAAARALRQGTPLVYLYVGELDHTGHQSGWTSQEWLAQLERLDRMLAELLRRVPRGTRILLTADHGMIDTKPSRRIDIAKTPTLAAGVAAVAGEPRCLHLYVPGGSKDAAVAVAERWRGELGERALWIGTQAQSAKQLGPLGARAQEVVGDVVVALAEDWVVVDSRVHSAQAMSLPGVHGSFTPAEMEIPLLRTIA